MTISVSGVITICLTQCNTSPSHRVDQVVDCGLWSVGPLLFNGCVKLLDIGRNWNTLSYTPIQSIPNMLNGWHFQWVCWPSKNWDVFSFQELCTDPCNTGLCIIMLQHEVMIVDEWHNNGLQDLVTVSLCIQNAINKMHLCSLSITSFGGTSPEHADELPWDGFWQFVQKLFVMQTDCSSSCPGGSSQTILEVKMLDVKVLGWCGYTCSAVVRPVGCTDKFSEMHLGEKLWIFILASLRHTCTIIMLSNQHLDMPHLWGGWIISAKKCSLTQI